MLSLGQDTRGQMMTLGAVVASLLLMAGLLYAMSVTPSTAERETVDQLNTKQHEERVSDFVQVGKETGAFRAAILSWDDSSGNWKGNPSSGYHTRLPSSYELQTPLESVFESQGIAYNIEIEYVTSGGGTSVRRLVYQGTPGPDAAYATTTVTLSDDDSLVGPSSGQTVSSSSSYFAPDASPDGNTYNTVRVVVIAWQT
jgi:hypothetical protein